MLSQATAQRIEQQNNPRRRLKGLFTIAGSFLAKAAGQYHWGYWDAHSAMARAFCLRAWSRLVSVPYLRQRTLEGGLNYVAFSVSRVSRAQARAETVQGNAGIYICGEIDARIVGRIDVLDRPEGDMI